MKMQLIYFFLFIYCFCSAQNRLDSLTKVLQTVSQDSDKVKTLLQLSMHYGSNDPEKAFEYSEKAVSVVQNSNYDLNNRSNKRIAASAYRSKGVGSYFLGNYSQALKLFQTSLKMSEDVGDRAGSSSTYAWIGNTYYSKADFEKALQFLLSSLKLQEELGNKVIIAGAMNGIANIYHIRKEVNKALEYYFKSLELRKKLDDRINEAYTYNNIGLVYADADSLDKALFYHLKCLKIVKQYDDKKGIANSYANMGDVYQKQKKYGEALVYLNKSLSISEEISDRNGIGASYNEIGKAYGSLGDFKNAISYFERSLVIGREIGDKDAIKDNYRELAGTYYKINNYEKAMEYYESYALLKDSLLNQSNDENMQEMQASFDTEQKQKEIELMQKDKNIRELQLSKQEANISRQRIIIYSVIGGLLIMIFLISFIWRGYRQKRKIQLGLEKKNLEISIQKNQIEETSRLITDSIDYAKNIQSAILPPDEKINFFFPKSFMVFEPKNIVSGDFYWLSEVGETVLFATVDCAGEGVPGAFMSIMSYNMLENISLEKKLTDPSLILKELNKAVEYATQKQKTSINFTMDVSLIAFSANKKELQFAGTKMPLIIIRDSKLNKFIPEATKAQTIQLQKGDMVYLFTDGVKGDSEFLDVLTSISKKESIEQKQILQQTAKNQTDDVLVFGLEI